MIKMISNISKTLIVITALTIVLSCEEIIEIDLNSSNPKIVIEGVVTDQAGPYSVKITKTTDYYNPGNYQTVSEAIVTITDDAGNFETLNESSPGIYCTDSLQGTPGLTYNLSVNINGEIYEAKSTMPKAVEIDSIYTKYEGNGPRGGYKLVCVFKDKPGQDDFNRLKVYNNNEPESGVFLYNGRLSDGNLVEYERFRQLDLEKDDSIRVELFSIDEDVYEYYSALDGVIADGSGSRFGSTEVPANPISNINNDALGYFAAYSVRADSVIVIK